MAATFSAHADHVSVRVDGRLGVDAWQTLRDASAAAHAACLPLRLDIEDCIAVDYGGIGAIRSAQEKLSRIEVAGCSDRLVEQFKLFGVCGQCASREAAVPACPKAVAASSP